MSARDEIVQNWATQLQAMDEADTATLAECFTPDGVLVHMTGYRQPLEDWMAGIRAGEFVYHQVIEHDVTVTELSEEQGTAILHGHITTGHRADGSGQAWPLDVRQRFVLTDGEWLCRESVVRFDR